MVPFQVEDPGRAGTVAFERETPCGPADTEGEVVEGRRGSRRNMPAGQGGARLGRAGLAEKKAHHAAVAGAECQTPARGQVELARVAPHLGEHGADPAAAERLLEDPERLARAAGPDDDEPSRIDAEALEAGAVGMSCLAERIGLGDEQEGAMIGACEPGEERDGEAGGGARIAHCPATDFVERVAAEPAGKHPVETGDAERQERLPSRQGGGIAFDRGDLPPQSGKPVPCHENAGAHGLFALPVLLCSCFVLLIPEIVKRVKADQDCNSEVSN
jgi:hypothetical protein